MNITLLAVGATVPLFIAAAIDQYLKNGLPVAALYACFGVTNAVSLWVALKG